MESDFKCLNLIPTLNIIEIPRPTAEHNFLIGSPKTPNLFEEEKYKNHIQASTSVILNWFEIQNSIKDERKV